MTRNRKQLEGHTKRGRRFVPPLLELDPVELRAFRRHALPDMLWLVLGVLEYPLEDGSPLFISMEIGQRAADGAHQRGETPGDRSVLIDGALTSWERLPESARAEVLRGLEARGIDEAVFPDDWVHAMALYPGAPGRWLVESRMEGLEPDCGRAEELLIRLVSSAETTKHEASVHAMCAWFSRWVNAGMIRFVRGMPGLEVFTELLPRYPSDVTEDEAKQVAAVLRSLFGGMFYSRDEQPETQDWCDRFWRSNWSIFPDCLREPPKEWSEVSADNVEKLNRWTGWLEGYMFKSEVEIDPDLAAPDKSDVLKGMAWRAVRAAAHLVRTPAMWSHEHGGGVLRSLGEAAIQIRWMRANEAARPSIYDEFKEYGRGRRKKYMIDLEKMIEAGGPEAEEQMGRVLERARSDVNRDIDENFQTISIAGTFIEGKSLQAMADEVGLGHFYDMMIGTGSSVIHGDWSMLDDYVLVRCEHPLHNGHRALRQESATDRDDRIPYLATRAAFEIVRDYFAAMNYEPKSENGQAAEMPETDLNDLMPDEDGGPREVG